MSTQTSRFKKPLQAVIILSLIQCLTWFVGFTIGVIWELYTNPNTHLDFSNNFRMYTAAILIAVALGNILFVKNRCNHNSSDFNVRFIRIVSLTIAFINALILTFYVDDSTNTHSILHFVFRTCWSYLFYFSSLSLGNYFFNKATKPGKIFAVGNALLLSLVLSGMVYLQESRGIDKDTWTKAFKSSFASKMCNGEMAYMVLIKSKKNINYSQCMSLMYESVSRCMTKIVDIPDNINPQDSKDLGRTIGQCAGGDFYDRHLK